MELCEQEVEVSTHGEGKARVCVATWSKQIVHLIIGFIDVQGVRVVGIFFTKMQTKVRSKRTSKTSL